MDEEKPYSNREIREFLETINTTLLRIESQTSKTNGRVSTLERWRTGIGMSIAVFVVIVIPLGVYAYNQSQVAIQAQIESNVLNSLSLQGQVDGIQINKVSK